MRRKIRGLLVVRLKNPNSGEVRTLEVGRDREMIATLRNYGWVTASLNDAIQYATIIARAKGQIT